MKLNRVETDGGLSDAIGYRLRHSRFPLESVSQRVALSKNQPGSALFVYSVKETEKYERTARSR